MLLKFLRPWKVVAKTILNPVKDQWLDDLIAVSRDVTTRGGRTFVSIFLSKRHHPRPAPFCRAMGDGALVGAVFIKN